MFKKFDSKEDVIGSQQLKSSVQKGIRSSLLELYPTLEPYLDELLPKKQNFKTIKCKEHVELLADADGNVLFFKTRDQPYLPALRLLHQYPDMLPHQQVDKGAIKFVLSGAHIMCPGLTSPGAKLIDGIESGKAVAIHAEGKQHALAIGMMKMSTEAIRSQNKGIGVDNVHCLCDGLWHLQTVA